MDLHRTPLGVVVSTPSGEIVPIRHVIAIGRNYAEHAREQNAAVPDRPMVFTKSPASVCLGTDDITIPPCCRDPETGGPEQVDFEAELGVVIGPPAKDVREEHAFAHVLGYCCANDVSARWWQKSGSGGQFCRGKSFDTFCPIGPVLIPQSDVGDPQSLRITCKVNGELMQDDTTANMLFPVASLIAELSRGATLLPGTLILTGTPSGVGMARTPPRYLREGDAVEVSIERVGTIRNVVRNG
ncbi:MAG: fumarylacetoacetate hydrolase family protein [Phycisphaerales bacterium]|jgi:2-keto-4-pentenoate hydratase/2-oxohepta-3-ene-1,7-dioic acid hydratase in catechol pathway|nr:fumarylacetoacetate hydrolase family protein [Phycisphaerales bacterium]